MITLPDFIEKLGSKKIQHTLSVSRQNVDAWRDMVSAPTPVRAMELIAISSGLLTWQSIYEPYVKQKMKGQKKRFTLRDDKQGVQLEIDLQY